MDRLRIYLEKLMTLKYEGKKQPIRIDAATGEKIYPYIPDPSLIKAVNLSIHLKRPLLLEGEPGGGKTALARAVADELGLPYEAFSVKSTSKAIDLKYRYDTIGRLRDAQLIANFSYDKACEFIEENKNKYLVLEALGNAFENKQERTVVLIDEIDKADANFPNDLLEEIDRKQFYIRETGKPITANFDNPPIIFITSNAERKLPNAFLRRCLYYYVKFPSKAQLLEILASRFPQDKKQPSLELINKALDCFISLYKDMKEHQDERESNKVVGTSELIDWVEAMREETDKQKLWEQLEAEEIPFPETLIKSKQDRERYLGEDEEEEDEI